MEARDYEDRVLQACTKLALGYEVNVDAEIANACLLLDILLGHNYTKECYNLRETGKEYFYNYPDDLKNMKEVLKEPWMIELSRFKNMFEMNLKFESKKS